MLLLDLGEIQGVLGKGLGQLGWGGHLEGGQWLFDSWCRSTSMFLQAGQPCQDEPSACPPHPWAVS